MLQITPHSLSRQCCPNGILMQRTRLTRPSHEIRRENGEFLFEFWDRCSIFEEKSLASLFSHERYNQFKRGVGEHTVPYPALNPSSFFSVAAHWLSGTISFNTLLIISHSLSCSSLTTISTLVLWLFSAEGTCVMACSTICSSLQSGIVDSFLSA